MNIFSVLKGIYKKEQLVIDKIDIGLCIALTNILKLDKNNILSLRRIIDYLFYLEPKRYIMLLFIVIPFNKYPPFLKGIKKKEEEKEDLLYNRIAYQFDWSSTELKKNKYILDKVIDRDYWRKELSI
jgi:hypothetical protein